MKLRYYFLIVIPLILLMIWSGRAEAQVQGACSYGSVERYTIDKGDINGPYGAWTGQASCSAYASSPPPWSSVSYTPSTNQIVGGGTCKGWSATMNQWRTISIVRVCVPDPNYQPPPEEGCTAGSSYDQTFYRGSSSASAETPAMQPFPTADGACGIKIDSVKECYWTPNSSGGKDYFCRYGVTQTGDTIPPGEQEPATNPPTDAEKTPTNSPPSSSDPSSGCPAGTVNVGTDSAGTPICSGTGTEPASKPKTTTTTTSKPVTNADGSTSQTETTTTNNKDGSTTTTTTTTTTNADGSKSVSSSSSTTNAGGGGAGKADTDQDFCASNPQLNVCKNSSVKGACETVSCEGDAIQCAALKAAAELNCRSKESEKVLKESAQYKLGNDVLSGNDPQASKLPTKDNAATWNMPAIETSGWLGGGSCFADKQFTIQGATITIPFSQACQYLIVLRYVLMVIAAIVSFKLLSGSILKD